MSVSPDFIPVYMLTGFLESGKTSMAISMLEDERFTADQRTLILCCEEGETEYSEALLKKCNASLVMLEEAEEMTTASLAALNKKYKPERVLIEYNTMWTLERLAAIDLPDLWEWVQVITVADATTFDNYMNNMRKLLTDPMKEADLILINRCGETFDKSSWRRQLRALNPGATILFENLDGSTEDGVRDEDLPYDVKAPVIDISEEAFGILYLDAMDHPERYDGKTVRMIGQAFPEPNFPKGFYFFGRYAMTCCSNDIAPCGWVCKGKHTPNPRAYIRLTAKCEKVTSPDGRDALLLHETATERSRPTREKFVSFVNI